MRNSPEKKGKDDHKRWPDGDKAERTELLITSSPIEETPEIKHGRESQLLGGEIMEVDISTPEIPETLQGTVFWLVVHKPMQKKDNEESFILYNNEQRYA